MGGSEKTKRRMLSSKRRRGRGVEEKKLSKPCKVEQTDAREETANEPEKKKGIIEACPGGKKKERSNISTVTEKSGLKKRKAQENFGTSRLGKPIRFDIKIDS